MSNLEFSFSASAPESVPVRPSSPAPLAPSNERVKSAIVAARIDKNGGTMAEVRDSLNQRRTMRASKLPEKEREHLNSETNKDLRAFGKNERTISEKMSTSQPGLAPGSTWSIGPTSLRGAI